MITSRNNPRIKQLAALHRRKERIATGTTLVEGIHLVQEALVAPAVIEQLVVSEQGRAHPEIDPLVATAIGREIDILDVSDDCYAKLSDLRSPEGVAAVVRTIDRDLEQLSGRHPRWLVAAGVQDPGNAGALSRTAEAVGATACVFLDGIDPWAPRFLRASMGSALRLPCVSTTLDLFLENARQHDMRILVANAGSGTTPYDEIRYTPPCAICVGGEGAGIPNALLQAADQRICLPMKKPVESLNVAVAAGVLLYRARSDWECLLPKPLDAAP